MESSTSSTTHNGVAAVIALYNRSGIRRNVFKCNKDFSHSGVEGKRFDLSQRPARLAAGRWPPPAAAR